MTTHQITFSPTGGTKKVCGLVCQGIGQESVTETELCVPIEKISFPTIKEGDLAVISMPVFGGRIPALAKERLKMISANNALCVVVAVYGNRAYDDALLEMKDVATEMGFRVIAAIAAVAEHSIVREYGHGRPDSEDGSVLVRFGETISEKIAKSDFTLPSVPGHHPYKKAGAGPNPTSGKMCNACGLCVRNCPVGAISLENPRKVDKKKCISCMKCVADCPQKARGVGKLMDFLISMALKKPCASRKQDELFI